MFDFLWADTLYPIKRKPKPKPQEPKILALAMPPVHVGAPPADPHPELSVATFSPEFRETLQLLEAQESAIRTLTTGRAEYDEREMRECKTTAIGLRMELVHLAEKRLWLEAKRKAAPSGWDMSSIEFDLSSWEFDVRSLRFDVDGLAFDLRHITY